MSRPTVSTRASGLGVVLSPLAKVPLVPLTHAPVVLGVHMDGESDHAERDHGAGDRERDDLPGGSELVRILDR